jgi:hypothetical protein
LELEDDMKETSLAPGIHLFIAAVPRAAHRILECGVVACSEYSVQRSVHVATCGVGVLGGGGAWPPPNSKENPDSQKSSPIKLLILKMIMLRKI